VDDNATAIKHRFTVYREQSEPVVDFYSKLGLVRRVSSEGVS
jgi:adenylate kinase family enzyme